MQLHSEVYFHGKASILPDFSIETEILKGNKSFFLKLLYIKFFENLKNNLKNTKFILISKKIIFQNQIF